MRITKSDTTWRTGVSTYDLSGASGVVDHAGQEIDYTITVSNTGNEDLTGVTEIGRASCRERVKISVNAGSLKKKNDSYSNGTEEQREIDGNTSSVHTAKQTD